MRSPYRVENGQSFRLAECPTRAPESVDKAETLAKAEAVGARLSELADLLFYAQQTPLLLILQGMDTSGKDGTIRWLLSHLNAQSVDVTPFKVPTPEELAHDFLWRVHAHTPGRGEIAVFNRSHYEDVLVVRVHGLVPEDRWRARYAHLRHFEHLLADNQTVIRKFFLHISPEEQKERLLAREEETEKAWKLSVGDWKERERWQDYQAAYEDAIRETASPDAPWVVVPSDQKWYRNWVVGTEIVAALEPLAASWLEHLERLGTDAKQELAAFRQAQSK